MLKSLVLLPSDRVIIAKKKKLKATRKKRRKNNNFAHGCNRSVIEYAY